MFRAAGGCRPAQRVAADFDSRRLRKACRSRGPDSFLVLTTKLAVVQRARAGIRRKVRAARICEHRQIAVVENTCAGADVAEGPGLLCRSLTSRAEASARAAVTRASAEACVVSAVGYVLRSGAIVFHCGVTRVAECAEPIAAVELVTRATIKSCAACSDDSRACAATGVLYGHAFVACVEAGKCVGR